MVEMRRNKGLNVGDVVNSLESLERLLEVLALKVIGRCFPKKEGGKEGKEDYEFSEELYKIPFWKIVNLDRDDE